MMIFFSSKHTPTFLKKAYFTTDLTSVMERKIEFAGKREVVIDLYLSFKIY